jgi:tubulysin polyketide synthase-like protein
VSAEQMLAQARSLGIVLFSGGGKLRYEAPAGRLTPELRAALSAHRAPILDILEAERLAARRIVHCRDCARYIPSPPILRSSRAIWEMPGGCSHGWTSPDKRPPIYPFTGWYCEGWAPKRAD